MCPTRALSDDIPTLSPSEVGVDGSQDSVRLYSLGDGNETSIRSHIASGEYGLDDICPYWGRESPIGRGRWGSWECHSYPRRRPKECK